jgi:tetratricopeptide (TPR) repeat protein
VSRRPLWVGLGALGAAAIGGALWVASHRPRPEPPALVRRERELRANVAKGADPTAHAELIRFLLTGGRLADAFDAAGEAASSFPQDEAITRLRAECLAQGGQPEEAAAALAPLVGGSPELVVLRAAYLVRAGRLEEAVAQLSHAPPLPPDLALRAAQVYLDALRPDRAVELLRGPATLPAATVELRIHYGLALLLEGRFVTAEPFLQQAVDAAPNEAALRFYLGSAIRLSGRLNRLEDAETQLRRASELAPEEAGFHYELGVCLAQLHDLDGARQELERAEQLDPRLPEVPRDLARVLTLSHQLQETTLAKARWLRLLDDAPAAVALLQPLARVYPERTDFGRALAEADYDAGQFPATLALIQRLRKAHLEDAGVLWDTVNAQDSLQHFPAALEALDAIARITPQDAAIPLRRIDVTERMGQREEFLSLLERQVATEPGRAALRYRLGAGLAHWSSAPDRLQRAETELRRAIILDNTVAVAHRELGSVLLEAGRAEPALASLRRALDLAPSDPETLRLLGRCWAALGDSGRSEAAFARRRTLTARDAEEKLLQAPSARRSDDRLAGFYLRRYRLDDAIREWEKLERRDGASRDIHQRLAALYGHQRRLGRMLEEQQALRRRESH